MAERMCSHQTLRVAQGIGEGGPLPRPRTLKLPHGRGCEGRVQASARAAPCDPVRHGVASSGAGAAAAAAAAAGAGLRVRLAPRPLMGSRGRVGPSGNGGAGEGESGEERKPQEGRVARGKRRKGKGKAGAGQGGRGSGAEGKPGPPKAKEAAGLGIEAGTGAGPAEEGAGGGSVEEGARAIARGEEGRSEAGKGAQGRDDGKREERRVRTGQREDARPGRAQGRAGQVWGRPAGATGAAAEAEEEAAGRPAPGPALWRLPEELLLLVCSYLDARALGRLAQVCRWLRRFTSCDLLWRRIARASLNSGFTRLGSDL